MPAPDPQGLDPAEHPDGGYTLSAETWPDGNRRHRIARMLAIRRNLRLGGWTCRACDAPIPLFRRADARYCSEGCRKREARARRENRGR